MGWCRRLGNLFRGKRLRDDIGRELSFHLAEKIDELRSAGMSEEEARQTARSHFGNPGLQAERTRDMDVSVWLESTLRDLRHAARTLAKTPAFTGAAVLSLALGIGANSGIFAVVDALLIKPLPYPDSNRLFVIYERELGGKTAQSLIAPARLEDWNSSSRGFEEIAGSYGDNLTDTSVSPPERLAGTRVSLRFFTVLGTPPLLGRTLSPEEVLHGGPQAVVLSYRFWRRRFNADPGVLNRRLILGGRVYSIVGVMPGSFAYPSERTDVWLGAQASPFFFESFGREARFYRGIGRLKSDTTPEQALADLERVQSRLADQYPKTDRGWGVWLRGLKEERVADVRRSLGMLVGAVGLLLAIACGNVASLMLARVERRGRDVAVRIALGASRATVLRQLFFEGLLVAMLGATAGCLLAWGAVRWLRGFGGDLPRLEEIQLDVRVVVFTAALGLGSTILFALAPGLRLVRHRLSGDALKGAKQQLVAKHPLQRLLVTAQVTLTFVLLMGAGLLFRSLQELQESSPGFDPSGVISFRLTAEWGEDRYKVGLRQNRILSELGELPGVESVASTNILPSTGGTLPVALTLPGRSEEKLFVDTRLITAGYFETLRIPILSGQTCDPFETSADRPLQGIVNRKFVDQYFPGEAVVGRTIQLAGVSAKIVGVSEDARELGLAEELKPICYQCVRPGWWPDPNYLVRTHGNLSGVAVMIREKMRTVDSTRAVYDLRPLTETVATGLDRPRFNSLLLALFAGTALLLAAAGLYGTLSYLVAERTQEIGLRGALGATPRQILVEVIRRGLSMTIQGAGIGLLIALPVGRWVASLLFEVRAYDPVALGTAAALLLVVAAISCLFPAFRATRIDPMNALRVE